MTESAEAVEQSASEVEEAEEASPAEEAEASAEAEDSSEPEAPDADAYSRDGQPLRRVTPRQKRLAERRAERKKLRSIADVAAKAAARTADPSDYEVVTADPEVPPDEPNPAKRDRPTIGDIDLLEEQQESEEGTDAPPDFAGPDRPQNLVDLCRLYPLGRDRNCYIRVERLEPKIYRGHRVNGAMGEIWHTVTEAQFEAVVGGGKYSLQVYGPDPAGRTDRNTGAVRIRPLTKPVICHFLGEPRFGGRFSEENGRPMHDNDMFSGRRAGIVPTTSAEASIHQSSLKFAEGQVNREAERAREAEARAEKARLSATENLNPMLSILEKSADRQVAVLAEQLKEKNLEIDRVRNEHARELREVREQINELRSSRSSADPGITAVTELAKSVMGGRERDPEERSRVYDQHREEMNRLTDRHRSEVDGLVRAHAQEIDRLEKRIETLTNGHREELRAEREAAARREDSLRTEGDRRERALEERHKDKVEALTREHDRLITMIKSDHERELKANDRNHDLVLQTRGSSHESQIAIKDQQITILKEEMERLRAELAEKDDLDKQIENVTRSAAKLGFSKQEPDEKMTWQERIADSVGKAIINADKTVARAADMLKERNEGLRLQLAAADRARASRMAEEEHAPMGVPPQQRRRIRTAEGTPDVRRTTWATEDGAPIDTTGDVAVSVTQPRYVEGSSPMAEGPPEMPSQPRSVQSEAFVEEADPEPPPPHFEPPTRRRPPPQAAPQPLQIDPDDLERLRQWVEVSIEREDDPAEFAREFIASVGYQAAAQVQSQISPQQLFAALEQTPAMAKSPILRPAGQKFVRAVWAAIADQVEEGPPKA